MGPGRAAEWSHVVRTLQRTVVLLAPLRESATRKRVLTIYALERFQNRSRGQQRRSRCSLRHVSGRVARLLTKLDWSGEAFSPRRWPETIYASSRAGRTTAARSWRRAVCRARRLRGSFVASRTCVTPLADAARRQVVSRGKRRAAGPARVRGLAAAHAVTLAGRNGQSRIVHRRRYRQTRVFNVLARS